MTVRLILSIVVSFALVYMFTPRMIPYMKKFNFGQIVREEGPETHKTKSGTPTMGGVAIICGIILSYLLLVEKNIDSIVYILSIIGFGLVGFIDDYIKVVKKRNLGLRAYQKLIGQFIFAFLLTFYQYRFGALRDGIYIPLLNQTINLGWFYLPFAFVVVVGIVNSVNLTDGLDGLAAGVTIIYLSSYFIILLVLKDFLVIDQIYFLLIGVLIGALGAFLCYNWFPAKIFMGDVGSLAIGGAVASLSILTGTFIIFPVVGLVYFAETISVVLQVAYYKRTGRRIFLMSPLHHHYEQKGLKEIQVVKGFLKASMACGLVAVILVLI
ncbi:MAG: Phospho-N-acetylmuramoyl-pentapeptide-transferase [Clostridiales bacterium 38_11]|nr:MAG: Phospho-N-acetylmuramoyl-pentapeptide-transferase [Clostridiales bacterium 38_11]HBH12178.1 phospho-N-acetylmuramoyl-pentapeptide-transferase [Clostridiales bacterium]